MEKQLEITEDQIGQIKVLCNGISEDIADLLWVLIDKKGCTPEWKISSLKDYATDIIKEANRLLEIHEQIEASAK